jgi:hypothetical protein
MRIYFVITFLLAAVSLARAQESAGFSFTPEKKFTPAEKTIYYKLADNIIPLKIQQYGERTGIVFINLHDDETTSVDAARRILEQEGGLLIEVENNLQRNIRFRLGRTSYTVDPNSIFSREGIEKSLDLLGKVSEKAITEVEKFGQRILQLIPEETNCIIALHNNTPDRFTALEYAAGNKRTKDSKKVYINPEQDADDFFLTTDAVLYELLADKKFNTVLQDNKHCVDDGSLSVYCGKNNIRYVNCETEHGKTEQYYLMMKALLTSPLLQKAD